MKRFLWQAITLTMVFAIPLLVAACGDDDDNPDLDTKLLGTWQSTISKVWEYKNDILVAHWEDLDDETSRSYEVENGKETGEYRDHKKQDVDKAWADFTFKSDGTLSSIDNYGEAKTYKVIMSDGTMTVTEEGSSEVYQLQYVLAGGELIVTSDQRASYDQQGYSYYTIAHYQRGSHSGK